MRYGLRLLACLTFAAALRAGEAPPPGPAPVAAPKDALELAAGGWTKIAEVPPDPFGRELEPGRGAFLCVDPESGRFFRYGGYTPGETNDLWSFDLAARAWTNDLKADYAWPPPENRPGAGPWWQMTCDPKRKVIWFGGGKGKVGSTHRALVADLWKFDPAKKTFTAMKTQMYPAGSVHLAYDTKNDLLVRAPGEDSEWAVIHNRDATWCYDPNKNEWLSRKTPGCPKYALGAPWVYDEGAGKCVYLFPKNDGTSETWTYDAAAGVWEKLACDPSPPGRVCAGAAYLPDQKRIVIHGGIGHPVKPNEYGYMHRGGGNQLHDTWMLDTAAKKWTCLNVGEPAVPVLPGQRGSRMEPMQGMAYDARTQTILLAAPTVGVWALRLKPEQGSAPAPLKLAALPPFEAPQVPERVIPQAPPNKRLLDLEPMTWLKLGGGAGLVGGEVPHIYDETSGYVLKYGGCNNGGTTFASGYGNDLSAYDPATERWIALRCVDPAGPARPGNGCTRFYAYDPVRKCDWFAGGTAGNPLAASLPAEGAKGTWRYDPLKDRFELAPSEKTVNTGAGVVTFYDRANNCFVGVPKSYGTGVAVFEPETSDWKLALKELRAKAYTYPAYVESLKLMLVFDEGKLLSLDMQKLAWNEVATKGDAPATDANARPCLAYDPDHDLVLLALGSRFWSLDVKSLTWTALDPKGEKANVNECLVYDRRHKVFIAGESTRSNRWALRVK
ncbi:MAG: hypothetical protein KIS92_08110 [Planctomycetota bacterium]|nr:hypothetical protein [Planctomycetota bacterium]